MQLMQQTEIITTPTLNSIFDELDVSESTRADYKAHSADFEAFIRQHGLSRSSLVDYKRVVANRADLAVSTKNKYIIAARLLLKGLYSTGLLPIDISSTAKTFQQSRKHKKVGLDDQEVVSLSEKLRSLTMDEETSRLKAIASLLILQGLRQIEIVRLNVQDIELDRGRALILGKGRDDKEPISLHPQTVEALRCYLKLNKLADGPLFISRSHNSEGKRLSTRSIRNIVQKELIELGIFKTVHGCRHYFTSKLIKEYGGDLLEVSRYTRHKDISTLQVYWDGIKSEDDLPRYYKAFEGIDF